MEIPVDELTRRYIDRFRCLVEEAEWSGPLDESELNALSRRANTEIVEEWLAELRGPEPLCVEDGVDAEFVAYLNSIEGACETDEAGRVILVRYTADCNDPSLNTILARLAPLKHVRQLDLSESGSKPPLDPLTDDGLQAIANWVNLTDLEINPTYLTGHALRHLTERNPLQHLRLLRVRIEQGSDFALGAIQNCTELREIDISSGDLSNDGLQYLKRLANLERLSLSYTRVTGAGMRHLGGLKNLRKLSLVETAIDDTGLESLSGLPQLESLWTGCEHESIITDEGCRFIARMSNLKELSLSGSRITSAGVSYFGSHRTLKILRLDDTAVDDEAIEPLSRITSLSGLSVHRTRLTPEGVAKLRVALPGCAVHDGTIVDFSQ